MKEKFKINLEISERDKKLLMILAAVGILFCAWYFGYNNLMSVTEKYQQETTTLRAKQRNLTEKNNDREKYLEETVNYKNQYSAVFTEYANGTSQDSSLVLLQKIEDITGSWIKSTTFTESAVIYNFGSTTSSNPMASGQKVYSTDMQGVRTVLSLSYEAKYDEWKSLISYINNYYSKNTIDSISMQYNSVSGVVSGTMTLSTYAITGSQRIFTNPSIQLPAGTGNIFESSSFTGGLSQRSADEGDYIYGSYDYFIMVNAATSDVDSVIVGKRNDTAKESIVSVNSNDTQNITMKFTGTAGNYKVSYKVGDTTYPAQDYAAGSAFEPGDTLDILIMSSQRVSVADKSAVSLTLQNDTDMPLNVKVSNDDQTSPRINIVNKTGNIIVY